MMFFSSAILSAFLFLAPAETRDLAEALPPSTLAYIGWSGLDDLSQICGKTALGKLAAEPEIVRFRKKICEAVDGLILRDLQGNPRQAQNYATIKRMLDTVLRRPAALAVIDFQGPIPQLAILIDLGSDEQKQKFMSDFEGLLSSVGMKPPTAPGEADPTFRMLPIPLPGGLFYGVVKNHFILSLGTGTAREIETRLMNGGPSLAREGKLAAARQKIGESGKTRTCTFFVDVKPIMDTLRAVIPMMGGDVEKFEMVMQAFGFDAVASWAAETHAKDGGFFSCSLVSYTEKRPVPFPPLTEEDLRWIPRDASFASLVRVNLGATFRRLMNFFSHSDSNGSPEMEKFFQEKQNLEKRLGFTLENGLLDLMGDRFFLFDAPGNSGIWLTGITVLMDCSDPALWESNLKRVLEEISKEAGVAQPEFIRESYRDREIVTLKIPGVPIPIAPAWTRFEKRLLVGLYPQIVRAALDRLAAGNSAETSILSNPDFEQARKAAGGIGAELHFSNTRKALEWAYPMTMPLLQTGLSMGAAQGFHLDISDLPGQGALTRHLFARTATVFYEAEETREVAYGPLPFSIPLVDGSSLGGVLVASAILFPAIESARGRSKQTYNTQTLRMVALASRQYEQDHGRLAGTIEDLRPYLGGEIPKAAEDNSPLPSFQLALPSLGSKAARPDREICAFLRFDLQYQGEVPVVFWDGHAEVLNVAHVQQLLEEMKTGQGK